MGDRVPILWSSIEALGEMVDGDPPIDCVRDCVGCPYDSECSPSSPGRCPAVLPGSGPAILRRLWRHLGGRELGVMEVPSLRRHTIRGWQLAWTSADYETWPSKFLGHGDITDPCEALAAIVAGEVAELEVSRG